jgi:hypothetical protein
MNRTLLEPEYFIYVRSRLNNMADPQYETFLKMVRADDEEFKAFLEKIAMFDF